MSPKRLPWTYSDSPIYFVTLVAYARKSLFANPDMHTAFVGFANRASDYGVGVGRYVLMPDHIHLFVGFAPDSIALSKWIKSLKNALSKHVNLRGRPSPHWQKGFFDHVLRSDESYDRKWEYVSQNPVRAGLVSDSSDWQFRGEICDLQLDHYRRRS
jgi:REP-associated tyrosine transposase